MIAHMESYNRFTKISHSSLLVNKIEIDQNNIPKHSEETLGHTYLRYLNNHAYVFSEAKKDDKLGIIKERLASL